MSTRDTLRLGLFGTSGVSRYDLVLAIIPSVFVLALLAGGVLAIPLQNALAIASVIAALAVADALFLNPPIRPGNRDGV